MKIKSRINEGTKIIITLQKEPTPSWFAESILIKKNIIILDDDETIHHVWRKRFKKLYKSHNIHHFTCSKVFSLWMNKKPINNDFIFLCDYELIGQKTNGIDIIKNFNISENSYLVTSHFEKMQHQCFSLRIKIVPKNLAFYIPLK